MRPDVSVLVAVKNETELLSQCLNDLLSQSLQNIEVLVIDDHSEPETGRIIQQFAASDPRIVSLNGPGMGQGPALNVAIPHAKGRYIANADADDRYFSRRLEEQMLFMDANHGISVCGCLFNTIPEGKQWELPLNHSSIRARMVINSPMIHSGVMFRAELLKSHPYPPDIRQSPDYALLAAIRNMAVFANIPFVGVRYRLPRVSPETMAVRHSEAATIRNQMLEENFGITDSGFLQTHNRICDLQPGVSPQQIHTWISTISGACKSYKRETEQELHAQAFRYLTRHHKTNRMETFSCLLKSGFSASRLLKETLRLLR